MVPKRHYCIPPFDRVDLGAILEVIGDVRYFVLHAPRQTGKTTTLKTLAERLNSSGEYRCVYANLEVGRTAGENVERAMPALLA